jgi:acyl-CoA thioesterase
VTGWFLLAGKANERFTYSVRRIREGGYTTRGVEVVQESDPMICFTCICSFKKAEKASSPSLDARQRVDFQKEYGLVLKGKKPMDHEEMPGVDAPWSVPSSFSSFTP